MTQQCEIIGIGRIVMDHAVRLENYPEPDTKNHILDHWFQVGGPVPTALVAARRFTGASARFIGQWGRDAHGDAIERDLRSEGIDIRGSEVVDRIHTTFAHVWIDPDGHRTIAYSRGDFDPLTIRDLDLTGSRMLHLDGHHADAVGPLLDAANRANVRVLMDAGSKKPGAQHLLPRVDLLIASEQCAKSWTGTADPAEASAWFLQRGVKNVVQTRGRQGAWWTAGKGLHHQPALEIHAVDTTGAGDVFCGGLIASLLEGDDLSTAVFLGCWAAGQKCRRNGNREALPSRVHWTAQKNQFLRISS